MEENKDITEAVLEDLLSDVATRKILESIKTEPKSTSQLCIECNIATSTAYRKMQKLYDYKFIRKTGTINESGKRQTLYKSNDDMIKRILSYQISTC
jgi:predicted transcriptional regulator